MRLIRDTSRFENNRYNEGRMATTGNDYQKRKGWRDGLSEDGGIETGDFIDNGDEEI